MVSPGKPSPGKSVPALSDAQVQKLGRVHELVNPLHPLPTGPRKVNYAEIEAQNPKATQWLLDAVAAVARMRMKAYSWGLEKLPETGPYISANTHVTQFDVFVPMVGMFYQGRRPRYMAKAEMAKWPFIGWALQQVGMQPVSRRKGQARAIEEESINILTSGRPLSVWPEGTLTRDPQKWPMSLKPGTAFIALEASRRLGKEIPLYITATWGAAGINHFWTWPRKNVVMAFDGPLSYADLLKNVDSWGDEPPKELAAELTERIVSRMEKLESEIRGEKLPEGRWDYRSMSRVERASISQTK